VFLTVYAVECDMQVKILTNRKTEILRWHLRKTKNLYRWYDMLA